MSSKHFTKTARQFIESEPSEDPFIVEIGRNDGVMLKTIDETGG